MKTNSDELAKFLIDKSYDENWGMAEIADFIIEHERAMKDSEAKAKKLIENFKCWFSSDGTALNLDWIKDADEWLKTLEAD